MEVNRKEFVELLSALRPGLAKKEAIEQSTCFVFRGDRIFTFNDEVAVTAPSPVDIEGALPGKEFYDFLNKLSVEKIDVNVEGNTLTVTSTDGLKFKGEFILQDPVLPVDAIPYPVEGDWLPLPENFLELLRTCLLCVSKDTSAPVLMCVHFKGKYMESCDNFKLIRAELGKGYSFGNNEALVLGKSLASIQEYRPSAIAFKEGWVHFRLEKGCVYSCRCFAGKYPNLENIISSFDDSYTLTFPDDILDAVGRAEPLAEEGDLRERYVIVTSTPGTVIVEAQSAVGKYREELEADENNTASIRFKIATDTIRLLTVMDTLGGSVDKDLTKIMFQTDSLIHVISIEGV